MYYGSGWDMIELQHKTGRLKPVFPSLVIPRYPFLGGGMMMAGSDWFEATGQVV